MTISKNFARVLLASSLAFTAHAFAQDGAPPAAPAGDAPAGVDQEMPAMELPKAPDIAQDFGDMQKSPEAVAAGEIALAKVAKSYRDAKSFSDTITIVVDMMGRKQEQAFSVARDSNGARLDLGGMAITSINSKVYLESSDAKGKYVAYPLDGTLMNTLEKTLGGLGLPMPRWILDVSEDADLAGGLAGAIMQGAKLTGFDAAGNRLLLTGEGSSVGVFTVDATSGVISSASINIAPPGAPPGFMIPLNITFKPVIADALTTPIAFSEEGKKQVSSPDELAAQAIEVGALAPDFSLKTLDGKTVSLADLKGKAVVIDFWAEWCGPCKRGLPHINEFAKFAKESGKAIEVYGINTLEQKKGDERITSAAGFWTKQGFTFPCLVDMDDSLIKSYGFSGIPATVVIGPDGIIVAIHNGIDPKDPAKIIEELKAECDKALAPAAG